MPPTLRWPFRFSRPAAFASATNSASRSASAGDERDVHEGAVLLAHGAAGRACSRRGSRREAAAFSSLRCLHGLEAALVLQPLEHLAADVDAVGGRRVVQASSRRPASCSCSMVGVPGSTSSVIQVLADDGDDHAGRADVLLHAAVDDAVLGHVHRLGQEARRHVGHQRSLPLVLGSVWNFGAVDGVVLADVHIVGVVATACRSEQSGM